MKRRNNLKITNYKQNIEQTSGKKVTDKQTNKQKSQDQMTVSFFSGCFVCCNDFFKGRKVIGEREKKKLCKKTEQIDIGVVTRQNSRFSS